MRAARRSTAALAAGLAIGISAPVGALAQQPQRPQLDCAQTASNWERTICGSGLLRGLLDLVAAEYRILEAESPLALHLRQEHRELLAAIPTMRQTDHVRRTLSARLRETRATVLATRAAMAARPSATDVRDRCVGLAPPFIDELLMSCRVTGVVGVGPGIVGQRQRWNGPDENDIALGPITALALLESEDASAPTASRRFRLAGWVLADSETIGDPLVVEGDGKSYITVPRISHGSAGASTDVVFARNAPGAPWREIDASSWFLDLQRRLPRGTFPRMAYSLDLLTLRATTAIARENDSNASASGGVAEVGLLIRDDALVIDSLVLRRPPAPPRPPGSPRRPG